VAEWGVPRSRISESSPGFRMAFSSVMTLRSFSRWVWVRLDWGVSMSSARMIDALEPVI
jgi:hypothetical protein